MKNGKNFAKSEEKPIAAIIADTHIKEDNENLVENIFSQTKSKMKEKGVKTLLHIGDWFHSRKGQPLQVLLKSFQIRDMLISSEIETTIIAGNHDKVNLDSSDSFINVLHTEGFNVIKEGKTFELEDLTITMIPYFKESGLFPEKLELAIKRSPKNSILLTHIAVNGVRNNDGSKVQNDLSENRFKHFNKVLVGHYHDQSQISNVYYIGSAYQANYGEDTDKGITWLYNDGSIEFEKLDFPTYEKIKINVKDLGKAEIEDISLLKRTNPENNIRIELTGEESEIKLFNKNKLYDLGVDVTTSADNMVKNISEAQKDEVTFFNGEKILKEFKSFCKKNEIEDIKYGKEKIEKCLM